MLSGAIADTILGRPAIEWIAVALLLMSRLLPISILLRSAFSVQAPWRWSIAVACMLTLVLVPSQTRAMLSDGMSPQDFLAACFRESLVGLSLGFGFAILLAGLQLAGVVLGQLSGIRADEATQSIAETLGANVIQRYHTGLALAVFWATGGHRVLVANLLDSLRAVPLGGVMSGMDAVSVLNLLLQHSMQMGIRTAAPLAFCLIVSSGVIALLSRSTPFLGAYGTSVAINLVIILVVSSGTVGGINSSYQRQWADSVAALTAMIVHDDASGAGSSTDVAAHDVHVDSNR